MSEMPSRFAQNVDCSAAHAGSHVAMLYMQNIHSAVDARGYRSWARQYHSAYEYVERTPSMLESSPLVRVASGPVPPIVRCILR